MKDFLREQLIHVLVRSDTSKCIFRSERVCPNNYNPADFFIATLAVHPDHEDQSREFIKGLCDKYNAQEGIKVEEEVKKNALDKGYQKSSYLEVISFNFKFE